jgi:hypothetical protein
VYSRLDLGAVRSALQSATAAMSEAARRKPKLLPSA